MGLECGVSSIQGPLVLKKELFLLEGFRGVETKRAPW